jgi:signal transduction histidine kinase
VSHVLGCTPEECYADPEILLRLIHPEDQQQLERLFQGTDVPKEMYVRWQHVEGRHVWTELHNVLVHDNQGALVAVEGIARDITEQKEMEERLLRAQRLETAGRIAGQVAHDFNNLLSPLVAYPQLIRRQLPAGHAAAKLCDSLEKAAQQMARINEDLLALGRRGHFNLEPVDLNLVVEQALEQLPEGSKRLDIALHLASDLPQVNGSEAQLLRAVLNLLTNAWEAMWDGGRLTISTELSQVDKPFGRYNLVEVGEYARLEINDTGAGIAPEMLDKIFDPFFTTKRAEKRRGSGLGLSIVQGIVSDHRGYIDVESELGRGTSFIVYLPINRQAVRDMPEEGPCEGCESILVVDDDDLHNGVTRELLETLGYQVSTASSGEEAVHFLSQHQVDLLVLDMVMSPGMDGVEVYRRALNFHPGQKAIILSGYSESESVEEAQALGAGAFLRKPVTLEKLARAVRLELERSKV